ncbi:MAG TPA: hypothetical protein VGM38_09345 [Pseudolysinimonas sp.]|jgi:hypothetical protein
MGAYVFSPSRLAFYAYILEAAYQAAGNWPGDGVDITDQTWSTFAGASPPAGKILGVGAAGQPAWVALPAPPPPTLVQQAATMLATGMQIVSTSNPMLNGTYPCDARSNSDDGNLLSAITAGLELPGGFAVRIDTSGNPHPFAVPDFKNYCQAKLIFQQQLNTVIGTGQGGLPQQPTVIP